MGTTKREVRISSVHSRSPVGLLVMTPAVHVDPDATLGDVSALMGTTGITAALMGDGGPIIITMSDIGRAFGAGLASDDLAVDVADSDPPVVGADTPVGEAAAVMLNRAIDHLVVSFGDGDYGVVALPVITAVLLQHADDRIWLSAFTAWTPG